MVVFIFFIFFIFSFWSLFWSFAIINIVCHDKRIQEYKDTFTFTWSHLSYHFICEKLQYFECECVGVRGSHSDYGQKIVFLTVHFLWFFLLRIEIFLFFSQLSLHCYAFIKISDFFIQFYNANDIFWHPRHSTGR